MNLKKIEQQLQSAPNIKSMMQLDFVQERFIANYQATTRKKDGAARFQSEVFAYMEIINEKPELAKAERFSHFAAIIKSGTTGLSFRDNKLYVVPGKNNTISVKPSPSGKREMMENMEDIKQLPEPQLVLKGDLFLVDKLNGLVLKHESTKDSLEADKLDNIVAAYQRVLWKDGTINDVIVKHHELLKARSKSPAQSDQSFWEQWPGEASKKVSTNRAFRLYHKYPDNVVPIGNDNDKQDEEDATEDIVYETAEVLDPVPVMDQAVKEEKKKKEVVETAKVVKGGDELDDFIRNN